MAAKEEKKEARLWITSDTKGLKMTLACYSVLSTVLSAKVRSELEEIDQFLSKAMFQIDNS